MKIEIEESALDSLKAMVQQLQDERDALLKSAEIMTAFCRLKYGNLDAGVYAEIQKAESVIAACKETKQVLAGK